MTAVLIIVFVILWIVAGLVFVAAIIDAPDDYREWVVLYPNPTKRFSIYFVGGPFVWFFVGSTIFKYTYEEKVSDKIELLKIWLKK